MYTLHSREHNFSDYPHGVVTLKDQALPLLQAWTGSTSLAVDLTVEIP